MCRLINQKLKDGTFVVAHTSVHKLVNEHAVVDLRLGDEEHALLLLSSLPDSWEILVISLNNSTPNGTFTMALVKMLYLARKLGEMRLLLTNLMLLLLKESNMQMVEEEIQIEKGQK